MKIAPSRFEWLPVRLPGPWLYLPGAFAAGGLAVLAFAPFEYSLLLPLGHLLIFGLLLRATSRQGWWLGYAYGLGLMGFGVSWLQISLAQFAHVGQIAAGLYTLGFVVLVAVYYGLSGWLIVRIGRGLPPAVILLLVGPAVWVLLEWLRGWLFTGFPWLSGGYAWLDTPLAGFAPLLGVYGLNWLGLLLTGSLLLGAMGSGRSRVLALLLVLSVCTAGLLARQHSWHHQAGEAFQVSLIQANIVQSLKWRPEHLSRSVDKHLQLTRRNWHSQLIIWPETAVPALAERMQETLLQPLDQDARAHAVELLIGIPRGLQQGGRYYNSLQNLGGEAGFYAKRHLVPFGEYPPLRALLKSLIDRLGVTMGDFAPGEADAPLLQVLGYPMGISICYEDAFANELLDALPEAVMLINVSNDGWFGDSLAPWQHLQIARMRALESGRYLLRATNTGISAVIGPDGTLLKTSALMQEAVVTAHVTPLTGSTPYVRWGNGPVVSLLLGLLLATPVWRRLSD
jgi:apolipoprotein N-acyltransferase